MENPETGQILVEEKELIEASVKYVVKLPTNRDPKADFKFEFETMEKLHDFRLTESKSEESLLSEEDFKALLIHLSKKNKEKYEFILKAGGSFKSLYSDYSRKYGSLQQNQPVGRKPCVTNCTNKG